MKLASWISLHEHRIRRIASVCTGIYAGRNRRYAAIWFKGAAHQGMTTCMQGKAVDVSKWKRTKAQCPAPASSH